MDTFNEMECRMRLYDLNHTHECITKMSLWCLSREKFHREIVEIWEEIAAEATSDYLILMFYVANDIVQHSKRNDLAFHYSFLPAFQKIMPLFSDHFSKGKVSRILAIWSERSVYNETILSGLEKSLSEGVEYPDPNEMTADPSNTDFEPFFSALRASLPSRNESASPKDPDEITENVKKEDSADEIRSNMSRIQKEIKDRRNLIEVLEKGIDAYQAAMDEASEVHQACKELLSRIKSVQNVLEEKHDISPFTSNFAFEEQTDFRSKNSFINDETCPYKKKLSTQLEEYLCEGNFQEENYVNSDAPKHSFSERGSLGYGNSHFPSPSSYYQPSSSSQHFQGGPSNSLKPPEFFEVLDDTGSFLQSRYSQGGPRLHTADEGWREPVRSQVWTQAPRHYYERPGNDWVRGETSRRVRDWKNLTDDSKIYSMK